MVTPFFSCGTRYDVYIKCFTGIFWAILGVAVVLVLAILFVPRQEYLAISNYLQNFTAIAGAMFLMVAWYRYGRPEYLLWAAGAFALWGLSNIAWYAVVLTGLRYAVFPSPIDIGIIASIVVLAVAFRKGFPQKQVAPYIIPAVVVIALIIPLTVIVSQGANVPSLTTLFYFLACGSLIVTAISHSPRECPFILAGTLLFALAFMIYPLREMLFIANPVLNVIGVAVFAGFSLIVIGILRVMEPAKTA